MTGRGGARTLASMPPAGPHDIRKTLETFLLLAYEAAAGARHAKAMPLAEIAEKLAIAPGLAEKVAEFLESEGLIDYDDQAVDITIPGMLHAEKILRGEPPPEVTPRPRKPKA